MTPTHDPYEIAEQAEHLNGLANIRAINKSFRACDQSELYPINGRFNVTERAIRKALEFQRSFGGVYGLEYALTIDDLISTIVNNEV